MVRCCSGLQRVTGRMAQGEDDGPAGKWMSAYPGGTAEERGGG